MTPIKAKKKKRNTKEEGVIGVDLLAKIGDQLCYRHTHAHAHDQQGEAARQRPDGEAPGCCCGDVLLAALRSFDVLGDGADTEPPDLYHEDSALGASVRALESARGTLRQLAARAEHHAHALTAAVVAQRALGSALVASAAAVRPPPAQSADSADVTSTPPPSDTCQLYDQSQHGRGRKNECEDDCASPHRHRHHPQSLPHNFECRRRGGDVREDVARIFATLVPEAAARMQESLGLGLRDIAIAHTDLLHLSVHSHPLQSAQARLESRYVSSVRPLRRRYILQKTQYLRYCRCIDMFHMEDDERRRYYQALVEACRPVWMRSSIELKAEVDAMTSDIARSIAQWSGVLAVHMQRMLSVSTERLAEAFNNARELQAHMPRSRHNRRVVTNTTGR